MANKPKRQHDRDTLELVAKELRQVLATLEYARQQMELFGIPAVSCSHQTEMERGIKGISNFAQSARIDVLKKMGDKGVLSLNSGVSAQPANGHGESGPGKAK